MIPNRPEVIMRVATLQSRLAPHGIRGVGLGLQAMPETDTIKEAFEPAPRHRA
jgi:hypothetical protein